jgi:hypothetical protein
MIIHTSRRPQQRVNSAMIRVGLLKTQEILSRIGFLNLRDMKGLTSGLEAKSAEPIALRYLGPKSMRSMQYFLTANTWDADNVQEEHRLRLDKKISAKDGMFTAVIRGVIRDRGVSAVIV